MLAIFLMTVIPIQNKTPIRELRRRASGMSYPGQKAKLYGSFLQIIGSFSNDDDDGNGNENVNDTLNNQNNNFSRALQVLVHFFAVTARLGREMP